MHFKVILTPKPRTLKQNAQEVQILIKAPVTAIITVVITVTITAAITAIITAAITVTKTTIKKVKGKAKERALLLKRWYKRLNYLNYVDVK
jgi:hypothetical protein